MLKADRKYKKPKPGKKRLVKFPRTLLLCQDQAWDEVRPFSCLSQQTHVIVCFDGSPEPVPSASQAYFYVWQFERPTSLLYYLSAVALPIVVILACLFPLAPWWMRMAFVYFLMTILTAMLSLIAVRYVLFGAVWTTTGYSLWLFPNMMSEEVS